MRLSAGWHLAGWLVLAVCVSQGTAKEKFVRSQRKGLAISVARVDSNSAGNNAGCTSSEFQCDNGKCIPSSYKCDDDNDCGDGSGDGSRDRSGDGSGDGSGDRDGDGSDEKDCASIYFDCENGRRIPASYICDNDDDCRDGSDERNCPKANCTTSEFQCDNRNCVPSSYVCDEDDDCKDKSDEKDCQTKGCTTAEFQCENQNCVLAHYVCDKDDDCKDGSDEKDCDLLGVVEMKGNCSRDAATCLNGASCTDVGGGFVCSCPPGFSGPTCGTEWGEQCSTPCRGENCGRLKTKMSGLLDMTVDPCEDFFQFACKPAAFQTEVPPVRPPLLTFEELVKKPPAGFDFVKTFSDSCMNISDRFSSLEVLYNCTANGICLDEEIKPFGQVYVDFINYLKWFANQTAFPVVTPDWEEVTRDWFGGQGWTWWTMAANILKDYSFLGTFQYVVGPVDGGRDYFRANLFFVPMIETTVDSERLGERDLLPRIHIVPMKVARFLRNGGDKEEIVKYKRFMRALLGYISNNATTLEDDIERIVELELELGQINTRSSFTSGDDWELVTINELYQLVPTVEWKDYILASLDSNTVFRLRGGTEVAIPSRELISQMGEWVKQIEAKRRDQANLLTWRMMVTFSNNFMHTGTSSSDIQENIFTKIDSSATSRSGNCLTQIKTFFPGIEDDLLVAQYLDSQTKSSVQDMWSGLKDEFERVINESSWMSRRTKIRAVKKLDGTKLLVGESLPDTEEFDSLKKQMSPDYIRNILAIGNYQWDTLAKSLGMNKPIFRDDEGQNNAFYSPSFNKVLVKTGLINGMLDLGFSLQFLNASLYGGFVASTLGHELTHAFDNNGRKTDKDGFELDWWETRDEDAFNKRTECLVEQYSSFAIPYGSRNYTMGRRDAGENIADNGGVKTAYRAFQRLPGAAKDQCIPGLPFSPNQLFWLGYAMDWCTLDGYQSYPSYQSLLRQGTSRSVHSPSPWRVNVVVSNMPEFGRDFNCPTGARLHPAPEDTCSVW